MKPFNILYVTGSRAEFGIMKNLLHELDHDADINLDLVVTGTHLDDRYGNTVNQIVAEKFHIVAEIKLDLSDDSSRGLGQALAQLTAGLSDVLAAKPYDLVIILGDRYEMLPVANLSVLFGYPICHIHGGETTLGSYDDFIRNAISKMSHLHLVSTAAYKKRLENMGEQPDTVYNIGAMGVDAIMKSTFLTLPELEAQFSIQLESKFYVFLMHTETMKDYAQTQHDVNVIFEFLETIRQPLIFIGSNADTHNILISEASAAYLKTHPQSYRFASLTPLDFYSFVKASAGIIGNSSSGLLEVPSLGVPTLNIGDRQKGRVSGPSVLHAEINEASLQENFAKLKDVHDFTNPYYVADSAHKAYEIIKATITQGIKLEKDYYEIK